MPNGYRVYRKRTRGRQLLRTAKTLAIPLAGLIALIVGWLVVSDRIQSDGSVDTGYSVTTNWPLLSAAVETTSEADEEFDQKTDLLNDVLVAADSHYGAPTLVEIAGHLVGIGEEEPSHRDNQALATAVELLSARTGIPRDSVFLLWGETGTDPGLLATIAFTADGMGEGSKNVDLSTYVERAEQMLDGSALPPIYEILDRLADHTNDQLTSFDAVEAALYTGTNALEERYPRDVLYRAAQLRNLAINPSETSAQVNGDASFIPSSLRVAILSLTIVLSIWLLFSEGYLPGSSRRHNGDPYFYAGGSTGLNRAWRSIVAAFVRAASQLIALIQSAIAAFGGPESGAATNAVDEPLKDVGSGLPDQQHQTRWSNLLSHFHIVAGVLVLVYGLALYLFAPSGSADQLATSESSPFWIVVISALAVLLLWDLKSVFQGSSRLLERIGPGLFTVAFTTALLTVEASIASSTTSELGIIPARPETGGWLTAIATAIIGLLIARAIYERLGLRLYYTSFKTTVGRIVFGLKAVSLGLTSFLMVRVLAEQARRFQGDLGHSASEQFLSASFWCVVILTVLTAFCILMALARGWERELRKSREDSTLELTLAGRFVLALMPLVVASALFGLTQLSHSSSHIASLGDADARITRVAMSADGLHLAVEARAGHVTVQSIDGDTVRHSVDTKAPYLTALAVSGVKDVPIVAYGNHLGEVFTSKAGASGPRLITLANSGSVTSGDGSDGSDAVVVAPPVLAFGPNAELLVVRSMSDGTTVYRYGRDQLSLPADRGPAVAVTATGPSSFAIATLDGSVFSIVEGIDEPLPSASTIAGISGAPIRGLRFDARQSRLVMTRFDGTSEQALVVDGLVGSFEPLGRADDIVTEDEPLPSPDADRSLDIAANDVTSETDARIFTLSPIEPDRESQEVIEASAENLTRSVPEPEADLFEPITRAVISTAREDGELLDELVSYFENAGIDTEVERTSVRDLPAQHEVSYALVTQKETADSYRRGLQQAGLTDITLAVRSATDPAEVNELRVRLAPGISDDRDEAVEPEAVSRTVQKSPPSVNPGEVFRDTRKNGDSSVGPELVAIPTGSFVMGSRPDEPDRYDDEGQARMVEITRPIAVSRFEVTWGDWQECVTAGACRAIDPNVVGGFDGTDINGLPIVGVTWQDAVTYTNWLSAETGSTFRLLTEAEWEYVARAKSTTTYWWGDEPSRSYANYGKDICCGGATDGDDRWVGVSPVGSFAPNDFGIFDSHGNASEWVQDCYAPYYGSGHPTNGAAFDGEGACDSRVVRGGSWFHVPRMLRSAKRVGLSQDSVYDFIGFRVAMELS